MCAHQWRTQDLTLAGAKLSREGGCTFIKGNALCQFKKLLLMIYYFNTNIRDSSELKNHTQFLILLLRFKLSFKIVSF